MNKNKIINDPVYGFITIPYPLLFDLIEHPYFQRLRRIQQLGLTNYVYPGAQHTRFAHALGAMHLMHKSIGILRNKGVVISEEESLAALVAILLHDIGHGPFSHTLENTILPVHHEELSLIMMQELNELFDGQLTMAINIFKGTYHRVFLHQLVSSQLDMDRMDYLTRDSFFTGVSEGVIGYDRIIHMLDVVDDQIVVEEKGIYSIEKYLAARSIMYWQTYLHKTVLGAEKMLIRILDRIRSLYDQYDDWVVTPALDRIIRAKERGDVNLEDYVALDDHDIMVLVKSCMNHKDKVLQLLCSGIVNRNIMKTILQDAPFDTKTVALHHKIVRDKLNICDPDLDYLVLTGSERNQSYKSSKDQIKILMKKGQVIPLSDISNVQISSQILIKYYLCYPKNI